MKSRLFTTVCCLLALLLLIVGCSSPEVPPVNDSTDATGSDDTSQPAQVQEVEVTRLVEVQTERQTLVVSFPGDSRQDAMENIIDSFIAHKAAQGVLVDVQTNQPTEGYYDQVLLDYSAGVGPDVLSLSAEGIPEFVSAGYLAPLDERVAGWDEWANFPAGMQEMPMYNGSLYAVMYDTDTRLIYYRTDVFEQAGLPVPWTPYSWADVLGAAEQIKNTTEGVIPLEVQSGTVWGEATTVGGFLMLLHGAGGQLLDTSDNKWVVESPAVLSAFQFYESMFANELSNADLFMEPEPWVPYLQEGFRDGNVGIIVSGSWMWGLYAPTSEWAPIPNRDEVVGWTPMPAQAPGMALGGRDYIGLGGGWGWSISADSEVPDLAWEFVQFMTSANSVSRYTNALGSIPARNDAETENEFFGALASEVLPYQTFRPAHPDYAKVSAEVQRATERIMLREASAQEAMQQFAAAVEAAVGADNVKRIEQ